MFRPTAPASVLHRARPPRVPILRSPFTPRPPKPTEGASVARPEALVGPSESIDSKVDLEGGLSLHYNPPPTAPSYTMGLPTDFTNWVAGKTVALTGEEKAPMLHQEAAQRKERPNWDEGMVKRIRELRGEGLSKIEVAKALNIPKHQTPLISRVAPLSPAARAAKDAELARQKASWGERKQTLRQIRDKRRTFW